MRPTKLTISTAAIAANLREIAQKTHSAVMAVVKADAYGHGAVPVARACLRAGAAGFAVATAEEALELRENGIKAPVLVLGAPDRELLEDMIARGVSFAVFDAQTLAQAQKLASARHTRALAQVGVAELAARKPHQLSGGQAQRVALAQTWAGAKPVSRSPNRARQAQPRSMASRVSAFWAFRPPPTKWST